MRSRISNTFSNPFLNFIVLGNFGAVLPCYLRREHFGTIRDNLSSLTLVQGSVSDALRSHRISFDAFNLSDIFEYMGTALFREMANELIHAASDGNTIGRPARFAYWNLLNPRSLAESDPERARALSDLASKLHAKDNAFFYSDFHVDERISSRKLGE